MKKFKPEDPKVLFTELENGVFQVYATTKNWHCPLAFVWGLHTGGDANRFDVLHSYTFPFARRCGLRTLINDKIFIMFDVDVIMSGDGTDKGGLAFMKNYGYELHKPTGHWFVTQETRKLK